MLTPYPDNLLAILNKASSLFFYGSKDTLLIAERELHIAAIADPDILKILILGRGICFKPIGCSSYAVGGETGTGPVTACTVIGCSEDDPFRLIIWRIAGDEAV